MLNHVTGTCRATVGHDAAMTTSCNPRPATVQFARDIKAFVVFRSALKAVHVEDEFTLLHVRIPALLYVAVYLTNLRNERVVEAFPLTEGKKCGFADVRHG